MEQVTFGGMAADQRVSIKAPWPVKDFTSGFTECSSDHGPLSLNSLRKSNWWTSCRWRKKSNCSFWVVVHLKARSSIGLIAKQKKLKWNSKITFNLESNPFDPFLSYCYIPHSCHSLHPMEHEFYEDNEYLSSLPADADRTEDFEYEVRSFSDHFTFLHKVIWGVLHNKDTINLLLWEIFCLVYIWNKIF